MQRCTRSPDFSPNLCSARKPSKEQHWRMRHLMGSFPPLDPIYFVHAISFSAIWTRCLDCGPLRQGNIHTKSLPSSQSRGEPDEHREAAGFHATIQDVRHKSSTKHIAQGLKKEANSREDNVGPTVSCARRI